MIPIVHDSFYYNIMELVNNYKYTTINADVTTYVCIAFLLKLLTIAHCKLSRICLH